jgi:hypothetical protein
MFVTLRNAEEYELQNPIATLEIIPTPNYTNMSFPTQTASGKKIVDKFLEVYPEMDSDIGVTSYNLPSGREFRLLPSDDNGRTGAHGVRDCLYITGPSGSGKTTYAFEFAKKYRDLYPEREIHLISTISDSQEIKDLGAIVHNVSDRKTMMTEFVDERTRMKTDSLLNSLVIFDDLDTLYNPIDKAAISAIQNEILFTGRHKNISVIICAHMSCNGHDTKPILNECNYITIFPDGSTKANKYLLEQYAGLSPKVVKHINATIDGRWITIYNRYPKFIFNRHTAVFPSELEKKIIR